MLVLSNCKLILELTEGTALTQADVVLEGKNIVSILPCGTPVAQPHETLDAAGATLLPGLIDMHAHLFMGKHEPRDLNNRMDIPAAWTLDSLRYAEFFLDWGFTTVRDVGDESHYPALALRNAINQGEFVGPRIVGSGMTITPSTAGFIPYQHICYFVDGVDEMTRAIRRQFAKGADFIKLYGTGSAMVADSLPGRRIMDVDEIRTAVALADLKGSYCAVHCHGAEAIGVMIDNGVHTIEHASFITDESCKKLDGRTDTGIVLTTSCMYDETAVIDGTNEALRAMLKNTFAQVTKCLRNAYENYNILIGWGTDLALDTHQQIPHIEWKLRKEVMGMKNIDLLKQATINGAKLAMYMDDKLGTVKEGKLADLILVDGNPEEDITVMYQKPLHVVHDGVLVR